MNKQFCCEAMLLAVNKEFIINYEDFVRNYNLQGKGKVYALSFCPFCGGNLGSRLNSEYFDILEKEYGIEYPDFTNFTNVPEEFKTDEWWRKRGL